MRKNFLVLTSLALLCLLLASCAGNTEKSDVKNVEKMDCSSSDYNAITSSYLDEWEGVITLSLQRFPGALEPQINDLERIMGEFKNLEVADCYQSAHEKNLSAMQLDLDGVKEFNSTGDVADQFKDADVEFAAAVEELKNLDN